MWSPISGCWRARSLLLLLGLVLWIGVSSSENNPLRVSTVLPSITSVLNGDSSSPVVLREWDTITVVFNRPVLPLGGDWSPDGSPMSTPPPFRLEGASVPGRIRWVGTYIARFDSFIPWPSDLSFSIVINEDLETFDGEKIQLPGIRSYSFTTQSLTWNLQSVKSPLLLNLTDNWWRASSPPARKGPQLNGQPIEWVEGISEVPSDGTLQLSFNNHVEIALLQDLSLRSEDGTSSPSFELEYCSSSQKQEVNPGDSCLLLTPNENFMPGLFYHLVLPRGSMYHSYAGPSSTDLDIKLSGPYPFVIPFFESNTRQENDKGRPGTAPEFSGNAPMSKRRQSHGLVGNPSYRVWEIYLRHGLDQSVSLSQLQDCVIVRSEERRLEEVPVTLSFAKRSKAILEIEGSFKPNHRYKVSFGELDQCDIIDGIGQPVQESFIEFTSSHSAGVLATPFDVPDPIFEFRDEGGAEFNWTYLTRNLSNFFRYCPAETGDSFAYATPVTNSSLQSVLCSAVSSKFLPSWTQSLRSFNIRVEEEKAYSFDTQSLLSSSGLFYHWDKFSCGTYWRKGFVASSDFFVTMFSSSGQSSKNRLLFWATASSNTDHLEGVKITLYSIPSSCGHQNDVRILDQTVTNEDGITTLEVSDPPRRIRYFAVFEHNGKLQISQSVPISSHLTTETVTAQLVTDRHVYRPGDPIYLKGYIRQPFQYPIKIPEDLTKSVRLSVTWKNGGEETLIPVDVHPDFGSFEASFEVPMNSETVHNVTLGPRSIILQNQNRWYLNQKTILIADPRPPTVKMLFETSQKIIRPSSEQGGVELDLETLSYLGEPVGDATVNLTWELSRDQSGSITSPTPRPGETLSGCIFTNPSIMIPQNKEGEPIAPESGVITVTTDHIGQLHYTLLPDYSIPPMEGDRLSVTAEWVGPTGELISSSLGIPFAQSELLLQLTPSFESPIPPHVSFAMFAEVRTLNGDKQVNGVGQMTMSLFEWDGVTPIETNEEGLLVIPGEGIWEPTVIDSCVIGGTIKEDQPNYCTFILPQYGRFLVGGLMYDRNDRPIHTLYPVGLTESEWHNQPFYGFGAFTQKKDREGAYRMGETAQISFYCPYRNARTLALFGHDYETIQDEQTSVVDHLVVDGPRLVTLSIPVNEHCRSGCEVSIVTYRPRSPLVNEGVSFIHSQLYDPSAPASHSLSVSLEVEVDAKLNVDVQVSPPIAEPGASSVVKVAVTDESTSNPVDSVEVCVFAVHRAWLDLFLPAQLTGLFDLPRDLRYLPSSTISTFATMSQLSSLEGYLASIEKFTKVMRDDPWFSPPWILQPDRWQKDPVDKTEDELHRLFTTRISMFPNGWGFRGNWQENAPMYSAGGFELEEEAAEVVEESFQKGAQPGPNPSDDGSNPSSSSSETLTVRTDFVITELHQMSALTDASGSVSIPFQTSDLLGSYAIMAFAAANDGTRFGQYPAQPKEDPVEQIVRPFIGSVTPNLPRGLYVGDSVALGAVLTTFSSGVEDAYLKNTFTVRLEVDCELIAFEGESEKTFLMSLIDPPKEVLFNVKALGAGDAAIKISLWRATSSGFVEVDAFQTTLSIFGCCQPVLLSSSVLLNAQNTDMYLPYTEGLQIPGAAPHSGSLILTAGVGYLPTVTALSVSTFGKESKDDRYRYSLHLLSQLVPWPALSHYQNSGEANPTYVHAKRAHKRALELLSVATDPKYGLQPTLITRYPSYQVTLNAMAVYISNRSESLLGPEGATPSSLLNTWKKSIEDGLYDSGRRGSSGWSCDVLAISHLALGKNWSPHQFADTLSMRYLDSIIDQCSSTGKAYRALTDLYSNPTPSRFVDRILNFLLSEIRVSGRLGYVGTDRYLDVTGSVISLEALVWGGKIHSQMVGKLAAFVGQGNDDSESSAIHHARSYGFGDQQIAYSLLALSSFDSLSGSAQPNCQFQMACGNSILLSGSFMGSQTENVLSSSTPFDHLSGNEVKTWLNGSGALNIMSSLSFVPDQPVTVAVDFGIRVEKVIKMLNHTTGVGSETPVTKLRRGDTVEVTIQIWTPDDYQNVYVKDPLPGGLEGLDDNLDDPTPSPMLPWQKISYWYNYFSERQFFSSSVEFYASYLPAGTHTITYKAIAVTRGEYLVPSTRAYLLLSPEVFGLTESGSLEVEGKETSVNPPDSNHCLYVKEEDGSQIFLPVPPKGGWEALWDPLSI